MSRLRVWSVMVNIVEALGRIARASGMAGARGGEEAVTLAGGNLSTLGSHAVNLGDSLSLPWMTVRRRRSRATLTSADHSGDRS